MAATAVADARLPVTVEADAPVTVVEADARLPATAAVAAIQRQAAEGRTAAEDLTVGAEGRTVAAVAADMEGKTMLDSFPA